ncbi:Uncharacterised protein [Legionella hackeliae]|nr:hypothetical protein Lhac_0564 [Legionella hackeliae]STX46848.1 Uncharacterised protein [Legionella hackeliae]
MLSNIVSFISFLRWLWRWVVCEIEFILQQVILFIHKFPSHSVASFTVIKTQTRL